MKSNTKVLLDDMQIAALCAASGFEKAEQIRTLGAGEFNAVYSFDSDGAGYALKIAPDSRQPVMTYERNMIRSEVYWYEQIRAHTDVPVPEAVYTDFSRTLLPSDFFIMRRLPGRQMNEMDFTPQERVAAVATLPRMAAQIHRIRHEGFGYPQCGLSGSWDRALETMVEAIVRDARAMNQSCINGDRMLQMIAKHRGVLARAECRMVNFDLWEANILCERKPDGIHYAWIDPERSFWGDPVMDFICFEPDKPLRYKHESLEAYNTAAERSITPDRETEIRFAFAQAYLGIIMEVERYYRYRPEDEGWQRNDAVYGQLLADAFACLEEG
jgi:aminoglycoside phosphotransferase (APT) family kinase protein